MVVSEFNLGAMIRKIERLYEVVVEQKRVLNPGVPEGRTLEWAGAESDSWAGAWR